MTMIIKQNFLLTAIISSSLSLMACDGDGNDWSKSKITTPATMTTVLYSLTQSEYDKIDANKLTIEDGKINHETLYRATGSGNSSLTLLQHQTSYVVGNKLFVNNPDTYQNSDFESIIFNIDSITKTIKDKQSGNTVALSTKLNTIDLAYYQPYKSTNKYDTIFSDWRGKNIDNKTPKAVIDIQFPKGSECYQKAELTTNKDLFIIKSEADKTIAKNLTELKLLIARMDAKNNDLEVSGNFTDVRVGSNNQLAATYSPSKHLYIKNGKIEAINFNGGGVVIGDSAYQAIMHKANTASLDINYQPTCDFYNETAAEYIFEQFSKYAN